MARFKTGTTRVEVVYSRGERIHRSWPLGCYRATIATEHETVDELLLSVPTQYSGEPESLDALREIALIAVSYSAPDFPDLVIERDGTDMPSLEKLR